MNPELSALERDTLASLVDWPRGSDLLSDSMIVAIGHLQRKGLIWRKGDCWTLNDAGKEALMADSSASSRAA